MAVTVVLPNSNLILRVVRDAEAPLLLRVTEHDQTDSLV